jgi:nitroreductase
MQKTKSIRAYQDKPAPRKKLEKILEAARLALSAKNTEYMAFYCSHRRRHKKNSPEGQTRKILRFEHHL